MSRRHYLWQQRKEVTLILLAVVALILAIAIHNEIQSQYCHAFYTFYYTFQSVLGAGYGIPESFLMALIKLGNDLSRANNSSLAVIILLIPSAVLIIAGIYMIYENLRGEVKHET